MRITLSQKSVDTYTKYRTKRRVAKSSNVVPEENWITVEDHCLAVGWASKALIRLLPKDLQDQLPDWVSFVCACHDVGKISPFQGHVRGEKIEDRQKYHELYSARALYLHTTSNPPPAVEVNEWYSYPHLYMILKHHGGSREVLGGSAGSFKSFAASSSETPWDEIGRAHV